jgi:hypothetical protein
VYYFARADYCCCCCLQAEVILKTKAAKQKVADALEASNNGLKQRRADEEFISISNKIRTLHADSNAMRQRPATPPADEPMLVDEDSTEEPERDPTPVPDEQEGNEQVAGAAAATHKPSKDNTPKRRKNAASAITESPTGGVAGLMGGMDIQD